MSSEETRVGHTPTPSPHRSPPWPPRGPPPTTERRPAAPSDGDTITLPVSQFFVLFGVAIAALKKDKAENGGVMLGGEKNGKPEETARMEGETGGKRNFDAGRGGRAEEEEIQSSHTGPVFGKKRGRKRRKGERVMPPAASPMAPPTPVGGGELSSHALSQLEELRREMGKIREEARKGKVIEEVLSDKLQTCLGEPVHD